MPITDSLGLTLTGAGQESLADYDLSLRSLQCFIGDPVGAVDRAIAATPDFVMAHVLKGYLYGLATEREATEMARQSYITASKLAGTSRERSHVAALGELTAGRWHEAGRILEDLSIENPRDVLALQSGHQIDFFTGNARMLRDRVARAMPAWTADMPGYHSVLGMQAFGLEEMGDYAHAEALGKRAIELQPRDGWAQHAVAHVMEMQCRQRDGIDWMLASPDSWTKESFLQVHNWWHLALFHYDLGEIDEVLKLYDGPIYGARSPVAMNMLDASAILWRLALGGVEVGDRWVPLAENWAPMAKSANYAFNDMHAMMAFVGAGRGDLQQALLDAQADALAANDDNAGFTRDVGQPVVLAILAFGKGDYAECVRLLRPVRAIAHRFGGSHAQRDVIDLTLIEAAFRAGDLNLARALSAERLTARPESPLSRMFMMRAAA